MRDKTIFLTIIGIVILGTLATFQESGMQSTLVYADYVDATGEIVETTTTNIESIQEAKKILALDGNNNDHFGANAAIYGDTIVFGVDNDSDVAEGAGSAYVFTRNHGGVGNWGQVKKLLPLEGSMEDDLFGISVAIFENTIVVGEMTDDEVAQGSGAAHVFSRHQGGNNNWGEVKKLLPINNQDILQLFGRKVAIVEDTIFVSAEGEKEGIGIGAVYVFSRNQGGEDNWGLVKKILSIDERDQHFGLELSVHGDTLAAKSNRVEDLQFFPEAIYVFYKDQGGIDNWGMIKELHSSDQDGADSFGSSIAVWDDTILIGAERADTLTGNTGAAYIFSRNQGGSNNWGEVKKITASDGGSATDDRDLFGASVDILEDIIIVGAPHIPNFQAEAFLGAAYLYSQNHEGENNWGEVKKLNPSDALDKLGYDFGRSVSITGGSLVVGASHDVFFPQRGAAYIYEYDSHSDSDGIPDAEDNCQQVDNINQNDLDGDYQGNLCDNYNLITKDTLVSEDQTSIGDVFVTSGKVLTVEDGFTLTIMGPIGLTIQSQPQGGVLIEHGATLKIMKSVLTP